MSASLGWVTSQLGKTISGSRGKEGVQDFLFTEPQSYKESNQNPTH